MDFLKLTLCETQNPVFVNAAKITHFYTDKGGHTCIKFGRDDSITVNESADDIDHVIINLENEE